MLVFILSVSSHPENFLLATLSEPKDVNFGVPQGSCAGPVLYTAYASSLSQVVSRHMPNTLGYADYHARYSSFKVTETENIVNAVSAMELCLKNTCEKLDEIQSFRKE